MLPLDLREAKLTELGVGGGVDRTEVWELENLSTPCSGGWKQEWEEKEGPAEGRDLNVHSFSGPTHVKGRPVRKLVTA